MLLLTIGELKLNQIAKEWYFCGKRILTKLSKKINYKKVRDHCHYASKYRASAHSISNLKFNVPNEIPVVFHNGSNYDYHFIIKELISKRVWGAIWMPLEKYRKVRKMFRFNRKKSDKNR